MKIEFTIEYQTTWGQELYICSSVPVLGSWQEKEALKMEYKGNGKWQIGVYIPQTEQQIEYYYLLKEGENSIRKEWGNPHSICLPKVEFCHISDYWQEIAEQNYLNTSPFYNSFFARETIKSKKIQTNTILLNIHCPYITPDQELIVTGESDYLGNWEPQKALRLSYAGKSNWYFPIDSSRITTPLQYKLAIFDKTKKQIIHWEQGDNRVISPLITEKEKSSLNIYNLNYQYGQMYWKATGVAIPVFSLRSEDSFGIGDFSDLKKMVTWASKTGQKIVQVLPINDTTISHTWSDSYPYSAISIYALHPLYLGLKDFPLKDKKLTEKYSKQALTLNSLTKLDYDKVSDLKMSYLRDLYAETGEKTRESKEFKTFWAENSKWLHPYACFSYFRDKFKTANHEEWTGHTEYDREVLSKFIDSDSEIKEAINFIYFVQFLLHTQLTQVKKYAHSKQVILKGDIPIGINRQSVESWTEPHLFNMDTQTGAPPDDFSVNGQNWGFPTYNWSEMSKDNYLWWAERFKKMADYFDAYRIDHILGFFRIWEIPTHSVQGLLGYFNPALPLSANEIKEKGLDFDEERMTVSYIHKRFLPKMFNEHLKEVLKTYIESEDGTLYRLRREYNTQVKIRAHFEKLNDEKSTFLRNSLYQLCNEVLFIRDKYSLDKFHPRIAAWGTYAYQDLNDSSKNAFNNLHDDYFYHRHNDFWKEQALKKLPTLINSTNMLVCGEDLGMIPACVPDVMKELQILSLEIQRMPKEAFVAFGDLQKIPYLSVCTTSTHDMRPIRSWWNENHELTQKYYNEILHHEGNPPEDCTPELCKEILDIHLQSSAMLVILPLQDWLSMDGKLRRNNSEEERINVPSISNYYWNYRMHLTIEELLKQESFNDQIRLRIEENNR